jgi:hypothetical protein
LTLLSNFVRMVESQHDKDVQRLSQATGQPSA